MTCPRCNVYRCEMPSDRRRNCLTCGKHDSVVGPISWRGNCQACGELILRENIIGIHTKQGYAYKRHARGMMRYAELVLNPDSRSTS